MPRQQLHGFVRLYLESKKAYPRTFPLGLALIYGIASYLVVYQMYVSPDVSVLSNLVRSSFLLVAMLACAEAVFCTFRRSTESRLLLVAASAVAVVAALGSIGSYLGTLTFFLFDGQELGVLINAVLFALMIKFDQTMDVSLLDTYK
ncbi:hypothetical protein RHODOSMS8_03143 [Rhodobiaceae bacterium]|nr:hypothetical protein RHODOSMS8_03143 [Rhodobiaceae bacterium]